MKTLLAAILVLICVGTTVWAQGKFLFLIKPFVAPQSGSALLVNNTDAALLINNVDPACLAGGC